MNIQEGIFWLIVTVLCEGGNQPSHGQKNITKVILNRAQKNKWPVSNVVLARKQFSCYNEGMPKVFEKVVKEMRVIPEVTNNVLSAISEWEQGDNLMGATHYYAPKSMVPANRVPDWAPKMAKIGRSGDHIFFREG